MKYCVIEIAFDNLEEVNKTCEILLKDKLVGSCQVVESSSKWNWNGKFECSKEYLLFLKTKKELSAEIYGVVKKNTFI